MLQGRFMINLERMSRKGGQHRAPWIKEVVAATTLLLAGECPTSTSYRELEQDLYIEQSRFTFPDYAGAVGAHQRRLSS